MQTDFERKLQVLSVLGDGEIRQISFGHFDVSIKIYSDYKSCLYELECHKCEFFTIKTDHMQNAISSINVSKPGQFNQFEERVGHILLGELLHSKEVRNDCHVLYFEPTAGGEILILCRDWDIRIDSIV
jgi:hypothetical protein